MPSAYSRRRGTAIIDTDKGILVVSHGRNIFLLPGGGARPNELQIESAIRELKEETGLFPTEVKFLFKYMSAKVFWMKTEGSPHPRNEIKKFSYYMPGSSIRLSYNTQKIIEIYLKNKKS